MTSPKWGCRVLAGAAGIQIRKGNEMIRNLKVLGLALMALVALSAVAATAASAANGTLTSDGPVTLTGTQVETTEKTNDLTALGSYTICPKSTYHGHKYNVTPHVLIPSGAETVTITPTYVNCTSSVLKLATTVKMNECDYVFHLQETTGAADTYGILATVVCPVGKHIEVTIGSGANDCTITITENAAGYKGLDVTDQTNGHLLIKGTIENITVDAVGNTCPEKGEKLAKLGPGNNSLRRQRRKRSDKHRDFSPVDPMHHPPTLA